MQILNKLRELFNTTRELTKAPALIETNVLDINLKETQMNLIKLLQAVYEIVKQIELVFPDSPGTVKFQAALDRLNAEIGDFIADKLPLVTKLINSTVAVLNIIGTFKKKSDSPAS